MHTNANEYSYLKRLDDGGEVVDDAPQVFSDTRDISALSMVSAVAPRYRRQMTESASATVGC